MVSHYKALNFRLVLRLTFPNDLQNIPDGNFNVRYRRILGMMLSQQTFLFCFPKDMKWSKNEQIIDRLRVIP